MPLSCLTTWRIGGPARFLSTPKDLEQFVDDLHAAEALALRPLALGGGSNLLFPDEGYPGLLLRVPPDPADSGTMRLSASMPLATAARLTARAGLRGLQWAAGIPGTIGGAIVNNAGAYGASIASVLIQIHVSRADGHRETWPAEKLALAYRTSLLKGQAPTETFLLTADFDLTPADPAELDAEIREIEAERRQRVPREPSCGCVFRNPPDAPAGQLIDQLGLAGKRCGDALISTQHANFIVNTGAARARDVLELIRTIRRVVKQETGIALDLEVQLIDLPDPK